MIIEFYFFKGISTSNFNNTDEKRSTYFYSSTSKTSKNPSSIFKIPKKFTNDQNFPFSQKSIAFLQPTSSSNQSTILPLETVLASISEEQTKKTKLILSDLGSKRRSRQRKPVMVVNSGNSPKLMLPKLNINNLNTCEKISTNGVSETLMSQNIVFSGKNLKFNIDIIN